MAHSFSSSVLVSNADMIANIESTYREAVRLHVKNRKSMKKLIKTMTKEQRQLRIKEGSQHVRRGRKSLNECGLSEYVYNMFLRKKTLAVKDIIADVEKNRTTTAQSTSTLVACALNYLKKYEVIKNVSRGVWVYCGE